MAMMQPNPTPALNLNARNAQEEKGSGLNIVQSDYSDGHSLEKGHAEWKPGFWAQFPWTGIGALVGVLICSAAAVIVVNVSNGRAKSQWKLHAAPNVLLNIFTSIASILITMAVSQGIAISWWRKALKGATVEQLHNSWSFSSSVAALVKKYKFWNLIALAALCTKFAIIDSTLFQKSLTAESALGPARPVGIYVFPVEDFPPTGILNQNGNQTAEMTYAMSFDQSAWLTSWAGISGSYLNGFQPCDGVCGLNYTGIGFSSSCTYTNTSVSRSATSVDANNNELLSLKITHQWPTAERPYSHLLLNWVSWVSDSDGTTPNPDCKGQLGNLTCELRPAVIDYPVVISNTSFSTRDPREKSFNYVVSLGSLNTKAGYSEPYFMSDPTADNQLDNFTIVRTIDIAESPKSHGNTSLGGIALALAGFYDSSATVSYIPSNTSSTTPSTTTSLSPNVSPSGFFSAILQNQDFQDGCPTGFGGPISLDSSFQYSDFLYNVNLLTLLLSDDIFSRANFTGPTRDYNSSAYSSYVDATARLVGADQLASDAIYVTRLEFAWGALASTVVVVLLILPSYWGFWQLGRKVSLGPLEIANAFEAPAFDHVSTGNGHVEGVLKAVGRTKVKYALHEHQVHGVKLGFRGDAAA